jgi:hypothetical protein
LAEGNKEFWWSLESSQEGWWNLGQLLFFQNFPKELGCLHGTAPVNCDSVAPVSIVVDDLGEGRRKVTGSGRDLRNSPGKAAAMSLPWGFGGMMGQALGTSWRLRERDGMTP